MPAFLSLATVIDLIISLTLLEAVALIIYSRVTGNRMAVSDFLLGLLSGLSLMLALRCAVHGQTAWVLAWLVGAGLTHLADIGIRWKRAGRP